MIVFVLIVMMLVYLFGPWALLWGTLVTFMFFVMCDMIASGEWPK